MQALSRDDSLPSSFPVLIESVDPPQQELHPWMEFALMWASDPQFDEFVAEMQAQRELDDRCEDIV